ncbi:MAG TPA: kelch repeat-containing protein, partial [Verrucomicrobiae bacterium]
MKQKLLIFLGIIILSTPLATKAATNFVQTSSMNVNVSRTGPATLLAEGNVMVAGGSVAQSPYCTAGVELYNPTTESWITAASLNTGRFNHTATLLPNDKVLVVGGDGSTPWLASAELYDPISQQWGYTGALNIGRELHTATLLPHGKVLVVGGYNNGNLASSELYDLATGLWSHVGSLKTARYGHTAT